VNLKAEQHDACSAGLLVRSAIEQVLAFQVSGGRERAKCGAPLLGGALEIALVRRLTTRRSPLNENIGTQHTGIPS
jgi:hypothetical protein